jgi:hypothetical protein
MPTEPLSAACIALAEYAVDTDLAREKEADLAARFENLRDLLPLIGRIYAEILAEVAKAPDPYKAWLAGTGQECAVQGLAVEFTRIIQIRQPWERALESLDAFLGGGASKPDAAKVPRKAKRLAWFLDPETQHIDVVEQSAKGRESRTAGHCAPSARERRAGMARSRLTSTRRARSRPWPGIRLCSIFVSGRSLSNSWPIRWNWS